MLNPNRRLGTALSVALDALLINLAFALAYVLRYQIQLFLPVEDQFFAPFRRYAPLAALLTLTALPAYALSGLYRPRRGRRWLEEVNILINGTAITILLVISVTFLATYLVSRLVYSRLMFIEAAALIVLFLSAARLVRRVVRARLRRRGIGVSRALIVGAGDVGRAVMSAIVGDPALGYAVVGFVDDDPERGTTNIGRFQALGGLDNIPATLREHHIDEVIVTLPWSQHAQMTRIVRQCERQKVAARIVPDVLQLSLSRVDVDSLGGIPMLGVREPSLRRGTLLTKRVIDLILTPILMLVGSLPIALVALAIKLDSPGPVIFRQRRVGKDGREFEIYKFRSMIADAEQLKDDLRPFNEADGPLFKIRDDPRLTRVGRLIRRLSLDELPQLYNILRGEMSLVGPRPGTPDEVSQYESWHRRRLEVYPGLTGLWQVSGRSDVTFDEMCLLDIYYIENWSLLLDLRLLAQTVPHVLFGNGAY